MRSDTFLTRTSSIMITSFLLVYTQMEKKTIIPWKILLHSFEMENCLWFNTKRKTKSSFLALCERWKTSGGFRSFKKAKISKKSYKILGQNHKFVICEQNLRRVLKFVPQTFTSKHIKQMKKDKIQIRMLKVKIPFKKQWNSGTNVKLVRRKVELW